MKIITGIAPVNIAVIKYWGKRDENLILPINDSISCTLSTNHMCAKTTIMASPTFQENRFWLNGKESDVRSQRLENCLKEVRKRASHNSSDLTQWKLHICSENNFPTAAGLASSAAGYACLVATLAAVFDVEGDISGIARMGSGSACRSVYGGWVQWRAGTLPGGEDSVATQVAPASHWPEMRIIVLVVNDEQKKYSSTDGMKLSVETSDLIKHRAENIVPRRTDDIVKAIKDRDFDTFARITMQDSNQFHAICLDTFPPCFYMNDVSRSIVELVHAYNSHYGTNKVAYTFDAGPNACLYLLEDNVKEVLSLINQAFPPPVGDFKKYFKGDRFDLTNSNLLQKIGFSKSHPQGCLKYIINTKPGEGPQILTDPSEHLLTEDGLPKCL